MHHIRVEGNYTETGRVVGQIHRDAKRTLHIVTEDQRSFTHDCRKHVERYAPGLIDEIKEASSVSGLDLDALLWMSLAPDYEGACGILAVSGDCTKDGIPIFGRNNDWILSVSSYTTILDANPSGSMRSLQFVLDPGMSCGGMNEAGLSVGVTFVMRSIAEVRPGVAANVAARWILDNLSTTDDAILYLKKIPHVAGYTFLIADAQNDMARVEVTADRVAVDRPESGLVVASTHFMCEEMLKFENTDLNFPWTYERVERIQRWFEARKGNITLSDVQDVLSDHDTGICCHWQEGDEEAGTVWSWTGMLGVPELFVTNGPPCKNEYQRISFSN
ncbi:MAG: C45 family autoproteolytic acyltransferase/hydrolase [Candidatus Thorarchaeota archaeon]|jgi:predicted choloylglycine hydrolase